MMGTPSERMVKAIAFLARARSPVNDGKRGLSWFSRKVPRRVESLHCCFTELTSFARSLMLPDVD